MLVPFVILLLISPLVVVAMFTCDKLLAIERARFPEQWRAHGSPTPFFQRGNASEDSVASRVAAVRCCLIWAVSMPVWVRNDREAPQLLRRVRVLLILWTFVAFPVFIAAAWLY
jgi:hypothetical protein